MNERRQEPPPRVDRVSWGLLTFAVLALLIAVDPPFGFGGLSIVASVVSGALIGLLVSRYFSQQASKELASEAESLRREAEVLRSYQDMTMRMLQSMSGGHQVATRRDEQGRPLGVHHHVTIEDSLEVEDNVEPTINPQDREDR